MNLSHEKCFSDLAAHLHAISRECTLFYVRNNGNWGDAVIAAGTKAFMEHFEIRPLSVPFRLCRIQPAFVFHCLSGNRPTVLLYTGGGFLTSHYRRPNQLKRLARRFDRLFLLPSTINIDLAAFQLHSAQVVYRRDNFESAANCPDSHFCHDLAFFWNSPQVSPETEIGFFFRTDRESTGISLPPNNLDIANLGTDKSDPDELISRIGRYRCIHTNRLHVAIAAAMIGRETHLYPNDYFKNRAVFESSLKHNYPNVFFHNNNELTRESFPA